MFRNLSCLYGLALKSFTCSKVDFIFKQIYRPSPGRLKIFTTNITRSNRGRHKEEGHSAGVPQRAGRPSGRPQGGVTRPPPFTF